MSKYGTRKSFDLEWVERWARTVNDDRILPVVGRFFTAQFVLGVDDAQYLVDVDGGKIKRIAEGLAPNDFGYDFGLKAPSSAWAKFSQQIPPPMFNDMNGLAIWICYSSFFSRLSGSAIARRFPRPPQRIRKTVTSKIVGLIQVHRGRVVISKI